ncbi:UDP-3-O-(3-hydroxymyristoyl)glucosamine N-acyltransferase [Fibrobacter sp. UBA3718]|uniref:UDP-3-O-(3-hydroxymyristoyl)glucosamine N-acyltransferase n=1 Tax=Fibrobacter sp. UBA3718 TaxID=1946531 RepID=UPI0025BDB68E|nr:UDP-3-O-(3-hydroxymyristoyl)glucosamine N-acyltransferase [Fibrobacter sp. UBA3718]
MRPVKLSVVLEWLRADAETRVSPEFEITGFASIDSAGPADASFWMGASAKNETNANGFASSLLPRVRAGLLFVPRDAFDDACELFKQVLCVVPVENPYHAMVLFLEKFAADEPAHAPAVANTARVHASAVVEGRVGENAVVGPGCVVMRGAEVGDGCVLEANVTVYPNVKIGRNCVFQAGAVIGSRGFGFYEFEGRRRPVPHLAGVRIGDNCGFGANAVVAAGFLNPTTIGDGCQFDSFVQIAHNCRLGSGVYMASQTAVAGSVVVEDGVEFAGGAKAAGHLTIGKGARVAAKAGVTKSVPAGRTVAGFPAEEITQWRRSMVRLRQMGKK